MGEIFIKGWVNLKQLTQSFFTNSFRTLIVAFCFTLTSIVKSKNSYKIFFIVTKLISNLLHENMFIYISAYM